MKSTVISKVIDAGNMGGDLVSTIVPVKQFNAIAIQTSATGSPSGSLIVEASLSYSPVPPTSAGVWTTIIIHTVSAAESVIFDLNGFNSPWLRVSYVRSSGTGSLSVWVCGKEGA